MNISNIKSGEKHRPPYCECVMDNDFILYNGNEVFYSVVGKNSFYPFTHGIHPDEVEEFKAACAGLKSPEDVAVLVLRYHGEEESNYQVYEVVIRWDMSPEGVKKGYNVELLNLLTVKNVYRNNMKNVRKYRTYMTIVGVYYFEYEMQTGIFRVFIYMNEKSIVIVNEQLETWYEKALQQMGEEKDRVALSKFKKALQSGAADFTVHMSGSMLSSDDTSEELICRGRMLVQQDGDYVYGVIRNQEGNIDRKLAYYFTEAGKDSATGLYNKRASYEYSKDLIADGGDEKKYMIVIDVDDFKDFNDGYGHIFGDSVIQKVSRVLAGVVNIRGIVGRIGGDEFYILTNNIDTEKDLRVLLKTISKNLYFAYEDENEEVHVTVSAGVSCYPDDGTDYDTLFKKADKVLYIAKEKGKNRFIIYDREKHGDIPDDTMDGLEIFKPAFRAEVCANEVSNVAVKLNTSGVAAMDEIMESIRNTFGIDGIQIASAAGECLYSSGICRDNKDVVCSLLNQPGYLKLYNEFFVYAENNVQNIEKFSKEAYDILKGAEITSFFHAAYPDTDAPKAFIGFHTFNRKNKWSEDDRNFLAILSKVLLAAVCRERLDG